MKITAEVATRWREVIAHYAKTPEPFSDEDALDPSIGIPAMLDDIERARPVYEAALAWGRAYAIDPTSGEVDQADGVLWRAVATLVKESK